MATYFFHEETCPTVHDGVMKLVRYYYDDISAEILARSFHVERESTRKEFLDNDRVPFADLRPDLKNRLIQVLSRRLPDNLRLAS